MSTIQIILLILFMELAVVYFENYTKPMSMQSAEFLNITSGTCSYQLA